MSTKTTIRMRLAILFLVMEFHIITPNKSVSDNTFRNLMNNGLKDVVLAAPASTLFVITGAVLVGHPRRVSDQDKPWMYSGCYGGYLADHVHGF